jgi:hypothetical protein
VIPFRSESQLSPELTTRFAATAPTNPFCSPAYLAYRESTGFQPWIFYLDEAGAMAAACSAFMKSGRLGRFLEIPSLPTQVDAQSFWKGLMAFCRQARVTDLLVNTFASMESTIPPLSNETWRKRRCEYRLDCGPDLWKQMRKGHWYSVKKGQKAGLTMCHGTSEQACLDHARLTNESMSRRGSRGERVSWQEDTEQALAITRRGAGEVFQAFLGDTPVSSNLILLAEKGGYNHSQGASKEGMNCGAPHFLIYEIVNHLRNNAACEVFNLGGTDQLNSGLEQFKSGFGATTSRVELDAAEFFVGGFAIGTVRSAVRFIQGAIRRSQMATSRGTVRSGSQPSTE